MTKWIGGWKKNGWKTANGEEVKNRPELEQIDELMKKIKVSSSLRSRGEMVFFPRFRSNSNTCPDIRAFTGMKKPTDWRGKAQRKI